jgi:hypothetical protein
MNRADLVYAVCHLLGMRPQEVGAEPLQEGNELPRSASDNEKKAPSNV